MADKSGSGPETTRLLRRSRYAGLRLAPAAALALLSALAFASPAAALEQKLTASDGAAGDQLGYSVAIDGDTLVVGAPEKNTRTGAVYVYQRVGDSWTQTAKLTASDGAAGDQLGWSVAIDGDTIVAGASQDTIGANYYQGSVYTFARTGAAARTETAKLTASDRAANDWFGFSVAIDGDTIVAGAPLDDVGANSNQGSVYTFARTGAAARTETAKLTASDGAADDELGWSSVAIDGDTIVAGAHYDDVGANSNQGSVYTFARTGAAARTETAKLTASDGARDDRFGHSVAIDGDTIVAGAYGANAGQGFVYTFARTGAATRTETAKLTASDGALGDVLGWSVAIDSETIVAGAYGDDFGANSQQGSASVFFPPADTDADGVPDATDGCPTGATGWVSNATTDRDSDGCRDSTEDSDDDNDTKADGSDSCAAGELGWTSNATTDRDSDGCRDAGEDTDDDNDTVADGSDNCPTNSNTSQTNTDADAQGDACDADDDNDTVADSSDQCRTLAASTPSGCPAVPRSLTLSYSAAQEKLKGRLTATEPSCVSEDLVTVWKRLTGDDRQVGRDAVNDLGKYSVPDRGRPGRYYSTVDERVVPNVAACSSATSPVLQLR